MESFVDLAYRGLSLGRRVKLTQIRPTTGYLETPAPMPVGTTIAIATDEGATMEATVVSIHEQVGGSERPPGMTVRPTLEAAQKTWWSERVTLSEEEPAPVPRARSVTVRPRSSTIVEPSPAGAVAAPAPSTITAPMQTVATPKTTAPMPIAVPAVDPAMAAALAAASQTIANSAPSSEVDGRTVAMPAVDAETFERLRTSDEIPVARISDVIAAASVDAPPPARATSAHEVMDDGKQTTMMSAVDLTALGLEMPGTTGQMAAVKPDDDGDDEPDSRKSQPNLPSTVKKRKKKR